LKMLRPIPLPSTEIVLENLENVMEQDATRCMFITRKKQSCGACSAGISKITYVQMRRALNLCLKHLGLENRKKGLQFCFQIF